MSEADSVSSTKSDKKPLLVLRRAIRLEKQHRFSEALSDFEAYSSMRPQLQAATQQSISRCKKKLIAAGISATSSETKKEPDLTIIVPCYNSSDYIDNCLISIRNQTISNIQIIVVDDGSTDNTREIILRHADQDSRIDILLNECGSGSPGKPRNQALKLATGDFIGFVDSDDFIDADYFENMIGTAIANNSDLVIAAGHRNIHPDGSTTERQYKLFYFNRNTKTPSTFHPSSMIWDKIYKRRTLIDNCIYLGEDKAAVDVIFNIKTYYHFENISICDTLGYNYRRETSNSVTTRFRRRTNCDFELKAFNEALQWADVVGVDPKYKAYIKLKQFMSIVYTLKLISVEFFCEYFKKCCIEVAKNDFIQFRKALSDTGNYYMLKNFEFLAEEDLHSYISQFRPDISAYTISSSARLLPKTIIPAKLPGNHIVFFPDWSFSNSYQRDLYDALKIVHNIGCIGLEPDEVNDENLLRLLPLSRAVHIHWVHPFLEKENCEQWLDLLADAKERYSIKLIWTMHNILSHECKDPELELSLRKKLASICDTIICHSASARKKMTTTLAIPDTKTIILPHGSYKPHISVDKLYSSYTHGQNTKITLAILGDLRPYKNVEWAVSIVERVNRVLSEEFQIQLHIKGRPFSEEQNTFLLAKSSLHNWLIYEPKRLSNFQFSLALAGCNYTFLPYKEVLTSGLAINSISHGRPFIAPFTGELAEIGNDSCKILYNDEENLFNILISIATKAGQTDQRVQTEYILAAAKDLNWEKLVSTGDAGCLFRQLLDTSTSKPL